MNGKGLLQSCEWTAQTFVSALEEEVRRIAEPAGAKSALEIAGALADYIAQLQVLGRFAELREYASALHGFLARHPRLMRLRDLQVSEQVGVRLDTLFQDLYAAERVVTPASAREALNNDVRRRIVEVLVDANDWIKTPELVSRCNLASRQHLHQTLFPLREAGLVVSTAGTTNQHRATPLGHQIVREFRAEAQQKTTKREHALALPLLAVIVKKNGQPLCCPPS